MLPEDYHARTVSAAPIEKIGCETCYKELSENINEFQTHINILNRGSVNWKMCEVCSVEIRSSLWDKHERSKRK